MESRPFFFLAHYFSFQYLVLFIFVWLVKKPHKQQRYTTLGQTRCVLEKIEWSFRQSISIQPMSTIWDIKEVCQEGHLKL